MRKKGRGEIVRVSDLFSIYKNRLKAPESSVITCFQEVAQDLLGVSIEKERCNYSVTSRTLSLALTGPLKSEILLRKEEILAHLRGRLGERSAPKNIL